MACRARFIPNNPEKYLGDVEKIFARSSWEISVMKFFDSRPDILSWNSEECAIPYLSPIDLKVHQYFPDFYIEYRDKEGNLQREVVEVKPLHETDKKYARKKKEGKNPTWRDNAVEINEAKWKAAIIFCDTRGLKFRVITEKSIFYQGPPKLPRVKKERLNG